MMNSLLKNMRLPASEGSSAVNSVPAGAAHLGTCVCIVGLISVWISLGQTWTRETRTNLPINEILNFPFVKERAYSIVVLVR